MKSRQSLELALNQAYTVVIRGECSMEKYLPRIADKVLKEHLDSKGAVLIAVMIIVRDKNKQIS